MRNVFKEIVRHLEDGQSLVLATIVGSEGSTPRTAGSRMIVYPDGSIWGTIGGGRLEAEVMAQARDLSAAEAVRLLAYDLAGDQLVQDLDMICGGRVTVLVERLVPENSPVQWWRRVAQVAETGAEAVIVCELPAGNSSASGLDRFLVEGAGSSPALLAAELKTLIASQDRANRSLRIGSFGSRRFLVEPLVDRGTVFLFGAGHVSQQVAAFLAPLDFRCVVLDDRPEFANTQRFPFADDVIVPCAFHDALAALPIGPSSCLVILTRGHRHDETVLAQALKTPAGYIGMIGSRRKRDTIYAHLRGQGVTQADLDRVHCPIGLAIGAETPAEIALSIVAELVAERARRQGQNGG